MLRTSSGQFRSTFAADADEEDEYNFDLDYVQVGKSTSKQSTRTTNVKDTNSAAITPTFKQHTPAAVGLSSTTAQSNSQTNVMQHAQDLLNRYKIGRAHV